MQGHHFGHVGLNEDDALFRVDAGSQPVQGHFQDIRLNLGHVPRVFNGGQGVDVNNAVDAAVVLLEFDPVFQGAQIVAQVKLSRGPHTGQDGAPGGGVGLAG